MSPPLRPHLLGGPGLAVLDCAHCGCPLFAHVLRPDVLAVEINLIEDWGPLPACTTKRAAAKGTPPPVDQHPAPPGAEGLPFHYCPCPGYQAPLVFSYGQLLELLGVMGERNAEQAVRSLTRNARNHERTGRPRGRPPKKAEQAHLVSV